MTDPGFADRTYLEPLDLAGVTDVLERERPDAAAADDGRPDRAQPRRRARGGGSARTARDRADRRPPGRDPPRRGPPALPRGRAVGRPAGAALLDRHRAGRDRGREPAGRRPSRLHAGRPRRRLRLDRDRAARAGGARPRGEPDRTGAGRGVGARLGRVRARGRARPERQRRDHLLDREPRPDGRAHRRLGHRRAADDALRRGLPGAARRLGGDHPRGRGRHGRLEHPVRAAPRHRRAARDRDEPARLAPPRWPRRRPATRSPRSRPSSRSGTRSTRSRTTSPGRLRRASSRRSTTSSSSSRASRSRSSRDATRVWGPR